MASVYEKNGHWYIGFKDEQSRWRDLKTAVTTKTEAKRLAGEQERRHERIRLGVGAAPPPAERTVAEILKWWLEEIWRGRPSYYKAKNAIGNHFIGTSLADLHPAQLT